MARIAIVSTISIAALALSGCTATPEAPAVDDGRVNIVASTNVYGSIAESIGGDLVSVTSLISSSAQDPHSFEASASDQLALSKADLVIENGGGYDPFIDTLLDAASSSPIVINASDVSGLLDGDHADDEHADEDAEQDAAGEAEHHDHIEGFNEHVWYSFHAVEKIAEELAHELTELDPASAEAFEANLAAFSMKLDTLETSAEQIHDTNDGVTVAITEPVPVYLLEEAGLTNVTPDEFSEAIEEGTDVAPTVLADTLDAVAGASLLAYNSQTASPETEQVRRAAEQANVPVVEFAETLPDGEDYISWMTANVSALAAALR